MVWRSKNTSFCWCGDGVLEVPNNRSPACPGASVISQLQLTLSGDDPEVAVPNHYDAVGYVHAVHNILHVAVVAIVAHTRHIQLVYFLRRSYPNNVLSAEYGINDVYEAVSANFILLEGYKL
jgi:hypothetical protein